MTHTEYNSPSSEHIRIAQTSCKNCIFAIYDNQTQVNCAIGRIDIYREQNSLIEAYDDDKEFYVVDGRICNSCRNREWLDKQPNLRFSSRYQDTVDYVRQEVTLQFHLVVIADQDIEGVKKSINSVIADGYLPLEISVIRKLGCQIRPAHLKMYLDTLNIKWQINSITNPELDERLSVDYAVESSIYQQYVVVRAGSTLPPNYLKNIDAAWNDKLLQLGIVISNDDDTINGMMVNKAVHEYLRGNDGFDIEYKLKEYNNELLYQYKDIL